MKEDYQLVVITWNDAWQDQENFTTTHGIKATHAPMRVETLGYLVHEDEVGFSLANEHTLQEGVDQWRGRTFVPRAMMLSVVPYSLTKKRTKRRVARQEKPQTESIESGIQPTCDTSPVETTPSPSSKVTKSSPTNTSDS